MIKHTYNITPEQYEDMLAAQNGGCKLCGRKQGENVGSNKNGKLHVDHCHDTGTVRGLLCMTCNTKLGAFEHDSEWLLRALDYLS